MAHPPLIPPPFSKVHLKDYDPNDTGGYDQDKAREEREDLELRLRDLQEKLYAQAKYAMLIVLQAMDAGGKDGTIKKVFDAVNPQGVSVTSFKGPTSEDLAHDFLWRIHLRTPPKGYIGIFNRSHYEDVLVVRVNKLIPRDIWHKRYDQINDFERLLSENNTIILKFFLNISRDEQKARLEDRLNEPNKRWKFQKLDLEARAHWDDYMKAYEDVFEKTNAPHAPWHIVPANHKWYRNLVVARAIVEKLEELKLSYPEPAEDLSGITIQD
jgi:PPK2 family polyphosphate:nucleotide phosphotransferase